MAVVVVFAVAVVVAAMAMTVAVAAARRRQDEWPHRWRPQRSQRGETMARVSNGIVVLLFDADAGRCWLMQG